jgi:hypothetical protein
MINERPFSKRLVDFALLIGSALLVCVVLLGAFLFTETRGFSPLWVFLGSSSVGFFAFAREEYRGQFRSFRFVFFVLCWLIINLIVIVIVLGSFGWLCLFVALFIEQVLFYMGACLAFRPAATLSKAEQQRATKTMTTSQNLRAAIKKPRFPRTSALPESLKQS